ncbi:LytTR family DNA-binding domain-containing protein [Pedobacter sp. KR3-3]|uniref:LytTR family DNA-binding domain-containing protein n=1 Tax=Pedobacter albus TaxID=3113905 RepID=A0ABU7I7M0_9SPHI|nr:LytTR family DNA-binding domain-containing protein [Pedobacter sp. KR3-3]MEE1945379.1 LytTR family DNA-binding domain-containing protein [Pedobacter sp. KR3-3]
MLTCYIIDDDIYSIESVIKHIEKMPNLSLIGSSTSPLIGLEELQTGEKPDIVFLDIEMHELSGTDIADLLPDDVAIIFTTGYVKKAHEAFEKNATDFLLKPYSFERFVKAVSKVSSTSVQPDKIYQKEKIFIKTGEKNSIVSIRVSEILYVEALKNYTHIYARGNKYVARASLKEVHEILPYSLFSRVHRSFIVNIMAIKSIETDDVIIMDNDSTVPLGELYKSSFMKGIRSKTIMKNH